jgi:transcription initiation factor TFIIF subunit beta
LDKCGEKSYNFVLFQHLTGTRDELVQEQDKLSVLGTVHQKLECRPVPNSQYMLLKKEEIRKASQPGRQVQQLDRVVQNYKPVADHKNNVWLCHVICILKR